MFPFKATLVLQRVELGVLVAQPARLGTDPLEDGIHASLRRRLRTCANTDEWIGRCGLFDP